MKINLSGTVALVTGASRGIGEAIARKLGEAGATVVIHYFKNEKRAQALAESIGNDSSAIGADFSCPVATRKLMKQAIARHGHVDVLVNNAAIAICSPIEGDEWQGDWDETMAVNLRSVGILSRLAITHFRERGEGGRIINISSRAAFRGDTAEYLAYAASKGGLISLTKSIASHFGKEGVKCFALAPGFVDTDMSRPFAEQYGKQYLTNDLALNELTQPADVANIAVFLASGLADHATGTHIDVNAGSYLH